MVEYDGSEYYLDINRLTEICRIKRKPKIDKNEDDVEFIIDEDDNIEINELNEQIEINIFMYEFFKMCVERILFDGEGKESESEIMRLKKTSEQNVSFKIAMNTLIKNEVLKKM